MPGKFTRAVVCFEGGLGLVAWGLGLLLGSPPFERLVWAGQGFAGGAVAALPLLAAMWGCTRANRGPLHRLMREVEERLIPVFASCSYPELALISIAAGIGEEALFRGVLQVSFARRLNPWAGLLAASALFGLGHFITPAYALLAMLIGFYLGGLFIIADNLLPAIVAHALYDFLALAYLVGKHHAARINDAEG